MIPELVHPVKGLSRRSLEMGPELFKRFASVRDLVFYVRGHLSISEIC